MASCGTTAASRSETLDDGRPAAKKSGFPSKFPLFSPRLFAPFFGATRQAEPRNVLRPTPRSCEREQFQKVFRLRPLEHTVHHPSETTQPACGVTALWSILVSGFRSGSSERTCQEMPHRLPRSRASCGTRFRNVVVHEAASFAAGLLGFFPLPYRHRSLPPMFGFGPHFTVSRNRADSG